jgi:hypothetical protein
MLIFMVFHPSRYFSIFSEIINEAKLIHHYINGYSYKIDPALNVLLPESILVMIIYFILFQWSFWMQIFEIGVASD